MYKMIETFLKGRFNLFQVFFILTQEIIKSTIYSWLNAIYLTQNDVCHTNRPLWKVDHSKFIKLFLFVYA